jgi:hypothetical protein
MLSDALTNTHCVRIVELANKNRLPRREPHGRWTQLAGHVPAGGDLRRQDPPTYPSRRACSRRASAGTARTARCGVGAGRGGRRRPGAAARGRAGPIHPVPVRGQRPAGLTRPRCRKSRRREGGRRGGGMTRALGGRHGPSLSGGPDLPASPVRADGALPDDRDPPADVPRTDGWERRRRRVAIP